MKLLSFLNSKNEERLGFWFNQKTYDLQNCAQAQSLTLPSTMNAFLQNFDTNLKVAHTVQAACQTGNCQNKAEDPHHIKPLAPVPHPPSCRDAYAFRQHVAAARRNRGTDMIAEFDQFPIFYFTNHNAIVGEGTVTFEKDHFEKLDFELEAAIVIGKAGKNIEAKDADAFIAGLTIMNDFSARQLQMEEMKMNLGPAKGKDFATAIGPWLVTLDELEPYIQKTPQGMQFNLKMTAFHNEKQVSSGNLKEMTYTFSEIIERCSYGVNLYPGDVIGSGTVGTGCYMELNGTWARQAKEQGKPFTPVWLNPNDVIELEIEGLGRLKHMIQKDPQDRSILSKKKNL
ncbi:MAG: fumarylacetoacetate hydrolase [Deltaproteobacteria bacterium RIFCSPHIGHO2_02_FULL_40_11]|nr:MAG: fumarylacetoacetate hydrolase [Deltaproteobacteria bacterium RIFCSPHIGHO2_02_FULL_40_11]